MCYVEAYDKLNTTFFNNVIRRGGIPIPDGSTPYAINYLCNTINLIEIWLQMFGKNHVLCCNFLELSILGEPKKPDNPLKGTRIIPLRESGI